jgi:hypothetical protein
MHNTTTVFNRSVEHLTDTPIFNALTAAATPIYHAMTTADTSTSRPSGPPQPPHHPAGQPREAMAGRHELTLPLPIQPRGPVQVRGQHSGLARTTPAGGVSRLGRRPGGPTPPRFLPPSAERAAQVTEFPRPTGRHRLISSEYSDGI